MADNPIFAPLPGIAALPLTTARQIGSGQVLVDTSSVVKELIDNALDARAKSIFVDITANTIDSIQVKDDGHGIPAEDRNLVCRRYCTSKIKDFQDLKYVGGRWLGFRGEALSSMAELSGTLFVTTRVEGEPVAMKLKYDRHGELVSTERYSHPVGTTVKATQFFEIIPVRKHTAIKNAASCLTKIRRLMQAYALARPTVRFRLHVLKATNSKRDFVYAPKAGSSVEDAVLAVIGKDCALQCEWTALESDDFEIHAFLPKHIAVEPRITNQGAFISIDSRPVSCSRGTVKKIVSAFKERLRKSNSSLVTVRDPFFCMNIICPPDSYDPNIEPAKDDVMFADEDMLLSVVDKLLRSYYPEAICDTKDNESAMADRSTAYGAEDLPTGIQTPIAVYEDSIEARNEEPTLDVPSNQPRWRSSMYGIEEDTGFSQENQLPVLEEEEGGRLSAVVSNPWTIARMNTPVKLHALVANRQLRSLAKSHVEISVQPSSPTPVVKPVRERQVEPLTPRTPSRNNGAWSPLHSEREQSAARLTQPRHEDVQVDLGTEASMRHNRWQSPMSPSGAHHTHHQSSNFQQADRFPLEVATRADKPSRSSRATHMPSFIHQSVLPSSRRSRKKQLSRSNEPVPSSVEDAHDTWFGQPMRGSGSNPMKQSRSQVRRKGQAVSTSPKDVSSSPYRPVLTAVDRIAEGRLHLKNNTDIRDFFRRNAEWSVGRGPSFRPIKIATRSSQLQGQLPLFVNGVDRSFTSGSQGRTSLQNTSRAASAEPQPRSYENANHQLFTHRPSSAGTERSNNIRLAREVYRHDHWSNNACDMVAHFNAYQDREINLLEGAAGSIRGQESHIALAHETINKAHPRRRRTTDGVQRTKSSKLPLERIPPGHHVQTLTLDVQLSIVSIVYSCRKLDMSRNTLEWGYAAEEAYDAFSGPVTERTIMDWAIKLDHVLHERFERWPGADTRSMLHEAIQRGLDERKEDGSVHTAEARGVVVNANGNKDVGSEDFDMSQFVEFDIARRDDDEVDSMPADKKSDNDFGNYIEDDMLLDL